MAFKKISSGRAGKGTLKEEGSEMEKGWDRGEGRRTGIAHQLVSA